MVVYVLIDVCSGEIYAISASMENIEILRKEAAGKTLHELCIFKIP